MIFKNLHYNWFSINTYLKCFCIRFLFKLVIRCLWIWREIISFNQRRVTFKSRIFTGGHSFTMLIISSTKWNSYLLVTWAEEAAFAWICKIISYRWRNMWNWYILYCQGWMHMHRIYSRGLNIKASKCAQFELDNNEKSIFLAIHVASGLHFPFLKMTEWKNSNSHYDFQHEQLTFL